MRHLWIIGLVIVTIGLVNSPQAIAQQSRCSELFPGIDWITQKGEGPTSLETAGMSEAESERFGGDVDRVAALVEQEIGDLEGSSVCLTSPQLASAFSEYVVYGQRLHAAVFAADKVLLISAVEPRMIDDSIAFGLPQIALQQLSVDLGLKDGYPDPLGTTIAHWYLARETGRLDRYRSELIIALFLDDPNPEQRADDDAIPWVSDIRPDPYLFDPQFLGSQLGVFIDYAVSQEGTSVLRKTDQATWAGLEKRWRIWIRDQYPRGSFGMWWGVAIVIIFIVAAILLAWITRRQKKRLEKKRPTPPPDESLFRSSSAES